MLDSCCLLGHVDFAFSYVFLSTHVSSCRSALEITKYYSHSTCTRVCIHWVCVYIATEMPTINKHLHPWAFRKTKVFFHPFTGKDCIWREQALHPHCFHLLRSSQKYFGINSSLPHFPRDHTQHSSVSHLPPRADGGAERVPAPLKAFPCNATRLQLSISPQRGLQMRIISLFSFPASEASLLLAVEKPSFLESSRFLLKIGIPVTEADPDQALPFCLDLHPSLGNSPSWKCLGYKYSPQNSLWHFPLYYINFPLAEIIPAKASTGYKLGRVARVAAGNAHTHPSHRHSFGLELPLHMDLQDP